MAMGTTYFQLAKDVITISPLSATIALLIVVCSGVWFWLQKPKNLPPGPLVFFPGSKPHEAMTNVIKKFGTVYSLRLGLTATAVVLNDAESLREVLVKQGELATNRNLPPLFKCYVPKGASLALDEGETWRKLRKFQVMAMRLFGNGRKILVQRINEEAKLLCDDFEKHNGKPVDPVNVTITGTSNAMNVMLFGMRYDSDDSKFLKMMKHLKVSTSFLQITDIANYFPFLYWSPLYKPHRDNFNSLRRIIEDIVEEHKQSYDPNDIRDILDLYLKECKKEGNGMLPHDHTKIWVGIYDLCGAATETTNIAMIWNLLYLAKYQDVQKKIQQQLDDVVGRTRQLKLEERKGLPWLLAAIREAIRLRPSAPIIQRGAIDEIQVKGYTIPKGATIIANLWAANHDPVAFPNPEVYDPTRHLTADGEYIENNPSIVSFGLGLRSCPGKSLADTELYLYIGSLLQRFNITLPADQQNPDMSGKVGLTIAPHPYKLCFNVR